LTNDKKVRIFEYEKKEIIMARVKTEFELKQPKLFLVKDTKMVDFLDKQKDFIIENGFNAGVVDNYFIHSSYSINDYMFYEAKNDTFWATKKDLAIIKKLSRN
jgi:hypothetical protein